MKYVCIFLLSCVTYVSTAQAPDPALFEHTWYLESLEIDDEVFIAPSNEEVPFIMLEFFTTNPQFSTEVCNALMGELAYSSSDSNFTFLDELDTTLLFCDNTENEIYEHIYFNFFNDYWEHLFNYEIINNTESITLIVTNFVNDKAYYNNQKNLSFGENSLAKVSFYPNPVGDQLMIQSNTRLESAIIYSVTGALVKEVPIKADASITVQDLTQGLYFVRLDDKKGRLLTKKFIKQ